MALQSGSAYSEYRLKLDGFYADIRAAENALRDFQAKAEAIKPPTLGGGDGGARAAAEYARAQAQIATAQAQAEQAAIRTATAQQRLATAEQATAQASQRLATEEARTAAAQANAARAAAQAEQAQLRLAAAAQKAAQASEQTGSAVGRGGSLAGAFKNSMLEVAGSFGLVTTGAAAATLAVNQLLTAFNLTSGLDASRRSLGAFLGDQQKANQAFDDAATFADRYKIKQTEVAGALQSLAPLIRDSSTGVEKQIEVLARLQSLNPAATFQDAAFSLKELASGDYASIADQFNLGNAAARELRDEIAAGADVFDVLDRKLNQVGASVDVLNARTEGTAGAQNRAAKAVEDFQLALGRLTQGPGAQALNLFADLTEGATTVANKLSGQANALDGNAAAVATASGSYEEYQARMNAAGAAVDGFAAKNTQLLGVLNAIAPGLGTAAVTAAGLAVQTGELTRAEFAYMQALQARGVAEQDAYTRAQQQGAGLQIIQDTLEASGGALDAYGQRLFAVASASDAGLTASQNLVAAYQAQVASGVPAAQAAQNLATNLQFAEQATAAATNAANLQAGANQLAAQYATQYGGAVAAAAEQVRAAQAASDADALAKMRAGIEAEAAAARYTALEQAITSAAAGTGAGVAASQAIAAQFGVEASVIEELIALKREQAAADAEEQATKDAAAAGSAAYYDAISLENEGLAENLAQKLEAELQTDRLSQAQGNLASLGSAVASGLLTAAQAAGQLAAQYRLTSAEALRLIQLQATLARQQAVAKAGFAGVPEGYLGAAIGGRAGGQTQGPATSVLTRIADEGEAAAKRYQAAVAAYEREERKAARAGGGGGGGRARGGRGGKGGGKGNSAAEREAKRQAEALARIDEQRLESARKTEEQLTDLARDSFEKRWQIQQEYMERQRKAEDQLRVDSLNSKADFYDALTQATPDIGQDQAQALSAAYEQAFAKAQELAANGQAELGARYLELRQRQIQQELQYQKAVAAAREKGDEAEVARLQAIEALRAQARDEELKQLLAGGDKNVAARDDALTAEQERYAEQYQKIGEASAERAAKISADEAKILAEVQKTNSAYAEQLRLQQQLGGRSPAAPVASPAATAPPPVAPTVPQAQAAAQQQAQAATITNLPLGPGGAVLTSDTAALAALQQLATALNQGLATLSAQMGRAAQAGEATAAGVQDVASSNERLADRVVSASARSIRSR